MNILTTYQQPFILKKACILICIFFSTATLLSQNAETENWYFGELSGLNFASQENPSVLTNSNMATPAGCSSISDIDGNLLFYTNGKTIWNNSHNIMVNGDNVFGDQNSAQNSIIIPIYGLNDIYYLFTVAPNGLFYAIIDMSLNNGLGEVTNFNIPVLESTDVGKLTAVHHADGESIWLMTTRKNENDIYTSFYNYKINTNGVIENPVISDGLFYEGITQGIMKYSPDGSRLAITNIRPTSLDKHISLFDFDNGTGFLSNRINVLTSFTFFEIVSAYGVEFSSDSKKLYATLIRQGDFSPDTGGIVEDSEKRSFLYQYNAEFTDVSGNSSLLHEQVDGLIPGSIQLAKSGKIYRAVSQNEGNGLNFLGAVNNPNEVGFASSYTHNSIDLNQNLSRLGLPNFIQSYFRTRILNEDTCLNEELAFEVDTYAPITAAQWDFGDGNTSNEISPNYSYSESGIYDVTVTITVNNRPITTNKTIEIFELPELIQNQELVQCDVDFDGISIFNLNDIKEVITDPDLEEQLFFFETLENAEQHINPITNPDSYTNIEPNQEVFVKVVNDNDCGVFTSFFLNAIYVSPIIISDYYVCEDSDQIVGDEQGYFTITDIIDHIRNEIAISSGTSLEFYPTLFDAQTSQNNIRAALLSPSTTIWVKFVEPGFACSGIGSINLVVNDTPIVEINDSYTFCPTEGFTLFGDPSNDRFEWLNSNGEVLSTLQEFTTNTEGTYTLNAYNTQNGIECSNSKTFTVTQIPEPEFQTIITDLDYNNNTVKIVMEGDGSYEFSLDDIAYFGNSNEYSFFNVESGMQTVYVRDIDQCYPAISKSLHLIGYPKFITPNDDGVNDYWQVKGLTENTYKSIRIFDRYGKLIAELNPSNGLRWDGRFNNVVMPSNDYWFRVEFIDGNVTVGNFSLKN
ncbi:T9SS type B sorting domain-containing protein [Winogradskyella luteola]|uniref:T9SS type B sorting domain-containing protein n=1 Tax=Winogradskyella luteola TaxID=2828330 RepID=A0A9X1F9T2_9FLAO|nr:T9SS type B sorting domain-containing protein [Winogradskyella luteola]MBV7269804.1 T9SS type B sorting domain-containing protein [Winogradskyella luteola]